MTRETSTRVDKVLYNRVVSIKEMIHGVMRSDLERLYGKNLNWNTEKITETDLGRTECKCADSLLITISVEENG